VCWWTAGAWWYTHQNDIRSGETRYVKERISHKNKLQCEYDWRFWISLWGSETSKYLPVKYGWTLPVSYSFTTKHVKLCPLWTHTRLEIVSQVLLLSRNAKRTSVCKMKLRLNKLLLLLLLLFSTATVVTRTRISVICTLQFVFCYFPVDAICQVMWRLLQKAQCMLCACKRQVT
jgi:hypothetical protein